MCSSDLAGVGAADAAVFGAAAAGVAGAAGATAGAAAALGFGGGNVDQKCRPHFGQTQNWSGVHVPPEAGSFRSMLVPHR